MMEEEKSSKTAKVAETQTAPRKTRRPSCFDPVKIDWEEVFGWYVEMPKIGRNLSVLHKLLKKKGKKVSYATVTLHAKKENWKTRLQILEASPTADPTVGLKHLDTLGKRLTSSTIKGAQANIINQINQKLPDVVIETPEHVEKMVKVLKELTTIVHDFKGIEIGGGEVMLNGSGNGHDKSEEVNTLSFDKFKRATPVSPVK